MDPYFESIKDSFYSISKHDFTYELIQRVTKLDKERAIIIDKQLDSWHCIAKVDKESIS